MAENRENKKPKIIRRVFSRIWSWLKTFGGWFFNPLFAYKDIAEKRQAQLLAIITLVFAIFNTAGVLSTIGMTGLDESSIVLLGMTGFIILAYVLSRTRYHYWGALVFIWSWNIGAYATAAVTSGDVTGTLNSLLAFSFILASALLNVKDMAILVLANILAFIGLGYIIPGIDPITLFSVAGTSGTIAILLLILMVYRNEVERSRIDEVKSINTQLEFANTEIEAARRSLEKRVEERTAELSVRTQELAARSQELEENNQKILKRSKQLEAISEVSQSITVLENIDELLPRLTQIVSQKFNYYHTGIFLLDEFKEYAVLVATNSVGGQRMLARSHKLKVGEVGIVGYVAGSGKPRIAIDTGQDTVYFRNPDLPETRSEMALPLKVRDNIIGVLDVQSKQQSAFSDEDIEILTTLANQVAIAIENSRLFEETRRSLAEVEMINRQYIQREWGKIAKEKKIPGFQYTSTGARQLDTPLDLPENRQVVANGEILISSPEISDRTVLAVPLKLRDELIGVVNLRATGGRTWSDDEIDLVKSVADRVALSVENARLFEETSNRAERERLVANISNKIRSTNDPETMVRTAIQELKQALSVSKVEILPFTPSQPSVIKPSLSTDEDEPIPSPDPRLNGAGEK